MTKGKPVLREVKCFRSERIKQYLEAMVEFQEASKKTLKKLNYRYHSVEDYVLRQGKQFESIPLTSDERKAVDTILSYLIKTGRKPRRGECFLNSFRFLTNLHRVPEPFVWKYVEGYEWTVALPIYHAWVSLNGKVVDSTLGYYGEFPEREEYFGVEFLPETYIDYVVEHREARALIDNHWERWPLLK